MKPYFRYILAPAVLAFSLSSCFEATPRVEDQAMVASVNRAISQEAADMNCEFSDRRTLSVITDEVAIIMAIRTEGSDPTYVLDIPRQETRYLPCNLPAEMQRDGMKVTFSGEEKQVFPDERWPGKPMVLTNIGMAR